jgi:hypothetical protein
MVLYFFTSRNMRNFNSHDSRASWGPAATVYAHCVCMRVWTHTNKYRQIFTLVLFELHEEEYGRTEY